jgi:histone H3/H4
MSDSDAKAAPEAAQPAGKGKKPRSPRVFAVSKIARIPLLLTKENREQYITTAAIGTMLMRCGGIRCTDRTVKTTKRLYIEAAKRLVIGARSIAHANHRTTIKYSDIVRAGRDFGFWHTCQDPIEKAAAAARAAAEKMKAVAAAKAAAKPAVEAAE